MLEGFPRELGDGRVIAFGSQSAGDHVARPTPARAAVASGGLVAGADQPLTVPVRFAFDAGAVDAQQPGLGAARTERANIAGAGPVQSRRYIAIIL